MTEPSKCTCWIGRGAEWAADRATCPIHNDEWLAAVSPAVLDMGEATEHGDRICELCNQQVPARHRCTVGDRPPAAHQERTEPDFFDPEHPPQNCDARLWRLICERLAVLHNEIARLQQEIARLQSAPAAHQETPEPQGAPIELVRQRACDFGEGYEAGYTDGLEGNASDSDTAWCRSRASTELAKGAPARAAEWQPLLREELETHGWDNPDSNYCWWCQYDVNGTDGPKHPHGANCWGVRASALLALPPGALAGAKDKSK